MAPYTHHVAFGRPVVSFGGVAVAVADADADTLSSVWTCVDSYNVVCYHDCCPTLCQYSKSVLESYLVLNTPPVDGLGPLAPVHPRRWWYQSANILVTFYSIFGIVTVPTHIEIVPVLPCPRLWLCCLSIALHLLTWIDLLASMAVLQGWGAGAHVCVSDSQLFISDFYFLL